MLYNGLFRAQLGLGMNTVDGNVLSVMVCKGTATIYAKPHAGVVTYAAYGSVCDRNQNGTK